MLMCRMSVLHVRVYVHLSVNTYKHLRCNVCRVYANLHTQSECYVAWDVAILANKSAHISPASSNALNY